MGHPRSVRKTRLLSGTCLPFAARCRVVRPAEGHEAHAGPASSGDALRPAICRREGSVARPSGEIYALARACAAGQREPGYATGVGQEPNYPSGGFPAGVA
jgi:hypothetical protein